MPAKTTQPSKDVKNPYGYTEMDWAAQLDPAYAAARAEVRRLSVGEEGTLSVKVKEFVVMGVLASAVWGGGPHAPGHRVRRHEGGIVRGDQSRRRPWGRHGLQCGGPGAPGTRTGGGIPAAQPVFPLAAPAGQSQPTPPAARRRGKAATR
jgi:hypothetical protein